MLLSKEAHLRKREGGTSTQNAGILIFLKVDSLVILGIFKV